MYHLTQTGHPLTADFQFGFGKYNSVTLVFSIANYPRTNSCQITEMLDLAGFPINVCKYTQSFSSNDLLRLEFFLRSDPTEYGVFEKVTLEWSNPV